MAIYEDSMFDVENTPPGPEFVKLSPIEVLLLDVQMPKLNGM